MSQLSLHSDDSTIRPVRESSTIAPIHPTRSTRTILTRITTCIESARSRSQRHSNSRPVNANEVLRVGAHEPSQREGTQAQHLHAEARSPRSLNVPRIGISSHDTTAEPSTPRQRCAWSQAPSRLSNSINQRLPQFLRSREQARQESRRSSLISRIRHPHLENRSPTQLARDHIPPPHAFRALPARSSPPPSPFSSPPTAFTRPPTRRPNNPPSPSNHLPRFKSHPRSHRPNTSHRTNPSTSSHSANSPSSNRAPSTSHARPKSNLHDPSLQFAQTVHYGTTFSPPNSDPHFYKRVHRHQHIRGLLVRHEDSDTTIEVSEEERGGVGVNMHRGVLGDRSRDGDRRQHKQAVEEDTSSESGWEGVRVIMGPAGSQRPRVEMGQGGGQRQQHGGFVAVLDEGERDMDGGAGEDRVPELRSTAQWRARRNVSRRGARGREGGDNSSRGNRRGYL